MGVLSEWVGYAFWALLAAALIVTISRAVVQRKRRGVRDALLPFADASAVQSRAMGWAPAAQEHPEEAATDNRAHSLIEGDVDRDDRGAAGQA
ncbi:hypothetical protein D9V32_09255 [Mycetocola tolaasinivorans]|uniref:Uncharacterized protein n=1 Tax=Mycetocola tolaasinivorans TaxID=76635 RepID=A0A3L7A5Q6_9MICO|nr:hypothetical protein [Mycetocola tolaasinivorans]RLP75649.1 hypothetical protein D9V32_09255 [Mycetocola tolaasinivorans]